MADNKTYDQGFADGLYEALNSKKELSLSSGTACILVKDNSLNSSDAPFYQWLCDNGFSKWEKGHGYYDSVSWVYINLNNKLFNPGMPGVSLAETIGHHAITIVEFQTIFSIFEKYNGKQPLEL